MRVAEGRYGARLNFSSKIWDNVATQIICEEAGALYTTLEGEPIDYSQPLQKTSQNFTYLVAPAALHKQIVSIMIRPLP
jgi:myo-inositol-1(or 4)-monophosphatase